MNKYSTAVRDYVRYEIRKLGNKADILVGIPCYNSEDTIVRVIEETAQGLAKYYPDKKSVMLVSDGGSLDDTREKAQAVNVPDGITKIVTIYRGKPGKGTAFRSVFEVASKLSVKVGMVFDSDLRSIKPEWVKRVAEPIFNENYEFVTPFYNRHKYDGTITNNIAYPLTRALYGVDVRQPIGGDFGFNHRLAENFISADVWDTRVAEFGIDAWMTTTAINENFRICQTFLGAKIHNPKDPSKSLGPMFMQVVYTLFELAGKYRDKWIEISKSQNIKPEVYGKPIFEEPEVINVSIQPLLDNFNAGYRHFSPLWKEIISPESFKEISEIAGKDKSKFYFPPELWTKIVYDFVYTFNKWHYDRHKLVDIITPLYYGKVGSFVIKTEKMNDQEAEELVQKQAETFEELKPYLISKFKKWEEITE